MHNLKIPHEHDWLAMAPSIGKMVNINKGLHLEHSNSFDILLNIFI